MIKKNAPIQKLDPAVEAAVSGNDPVLSGLDRLRRAKRMTAGQKRKAETDRQRIKVTFDVTESLKTQVEEIAKHMSIPASQVASLLMIHGLLSLVNGDWDLHDFTFRPSRSPRYDWVIDNLPEPPKFDVEEITK